MARNVVVIHRWGNSRAAIIPAPLMRQLKWRVADLLYVSVEGDKLVFRPLELPKDLRQPSAIGEAATEAP